MARLEGKKSNVGAIITSAIIFALVAGGLFFAFYPVPEPTNAGITNSVAPDAEQKSVVSSNSGNSENGLATILTPLPTATETATLPTDAISNSTANSTTDGATNTVPTATVANEVVANPTGAPMPQ